MFKEQSGVVPVVAPKASKGSTDFPIYTGYYYEKKIKILSIIVFAVDYIFHFLL